VLTKLRRIHSRIVKPIVKVLVRLGVKANHLTLASLILSLLYIATLLNELVLLAVILILAIGFLDAIDGEVARARGEASPIGSFLDSLIDRITDAIIIGGLLILGFNVIAVYTLLTLSMLISYCRAKGESLGVKMESIGLIERAERLIIVMIILILYLSLGLYYSQILLLILVILSLITLLQRVKYLLLKLKE